MYRESNDFVIQRRAGQALTVVTRKSGRRDTFTNGVTSLLIRHRLTTARKNRGRAQTLAMTDYKGYEIRPEA